MTHKTKVAKWIDDDTVLLIDLADQPDEDPGTDYISLLLFLIAVVTAGAIIYP